MTDTNREAVELGLYAADLTTKLAILPAVDVGLYFELNQPGSGQCKVHSLRSVASGLIQRGQFVRVTYRGTVQGGFFIEEIGKSLASQGESGDLWTPISGRGPMMLLEDGIVWTDGTEASTLDFTDQPKAAMLITLIEAAQARGALSTLICDFTASVDSNGDPWTDLEPMQFSIGKTLLDVAREISDFGVDMDVLVNSDGTFTLRAYNAGRGTDKSSTIFFRRGVNCTDITSDERGSEVANALLIKHDAGYVAVKDNTSITEFRRREKLVDAIDAGNSANAKTYGDSLLEFSKEPKREVSTQMYDGMPPFVFTDYNLGDWVAMDSSGVVESPLRVRSIQLAWRDAEKADVTVGLNTLTMENEIKQSNDIRKLFEMVRRNNDGKEVRLPFWAAIGSLNGLATVGGVGSMAVSDAGILYITGISKVGNVSVGNAARYDIGTGQWSKLGTGFDSSPSVVACMGTKIYFGGAFATADGVSTPGYVACWDEATETFTAPNVTGYITQVHALRVDGTRLYVGGLGRSQEHGIDCAFVGYLETADDTWHEMPGVVTDISPIAYAIEVNDNKVYVGCDSGGSNANVYAWDTLAEEWSPIALDPGPTYAPVYALKVYEDYLYIGGQFASLMTPDLDVIPNTIALARMNLGTEIVESFEGGLTTYGADGVFAFTVNGSDLIIGGHFASIGDGFAASNIVSWNGGGWMTLGTGLDGDCNALVAYEGNIGAGGGFDHAGGKPIKRIGAYITSLENVINYLETGSGSSSTPYEHPNHSGDVVSDGDGAQTIQSNTVTNEKLQNMPEGTVKARLSAGTGDPEDVTLEDFRAALGVTPTTYTPDRVIVSNASGAATTDSGLTYDQTTNQLDLGDGSPFTANNLFSQAADGASVGHILTSWGAGFAPYLRGVAAGGTKASPSALLADAIELYIRAGAHDGATYPASNFEMRVVADEDQAVGAHGSRLEFWVTPNGSATKVLAMTLQSDGKLNLEAGGEYLVDGVPIGGGGGGNGFQVDSSGGTADTYGVLSGAINGSNTVFSVSYGSYVSGALQVYLNGQLLTQGTSEDWVETTPASGTFTFATAPVAGDVIIAFYKYASVATSNADTLDGYDASAFAKTALPMVGRGTVEVDFGTGALSQVVTVTDALATSGSFITASILCKATASNTADEIMAQPFDVKIKSQTTGSFDIVVTSLIGKALQEVPVSYILMN